MEGRDDFNGCIAGIWIHMKESVTSIFIKRNYKAFINFITSLLLFKNSFWNMNNLVFCVYFETILIKFIRQTNKIESYNYCLKLNRDEARTKKHCHLCTILIKLVKKRLSSLPQFYFNTYAVLNSQRGNWDYNMVKKDHVNNMSATTADGTLKGIEVYKIYAEW